MRILLKVYMKLEGFKGQKLREPIFSEKSIQNVFFRYS